jgi:hypothetical protein
VDEQATGAQSESSPAPKPWWRLNQRRRLELGVLLALAVVGGAIAWAIAGGVSPERTVAKPIKPIALSASGLSTLAAVVGQPIYWAGPRPHYLYELKRTVEGNVYIRYLPPGVDAGASGNNYLTIATFPVSGALDALKKEADGRGVPVPQGGLALVDEKAPRSVRLAFPKVGYQVEVYDPSPAQALAVATSGQVRPA